MNELMLPVSIGEGLDKLTILDIKLEKINDSRKNEVKKEFDILNHELKNYKENNIFFYNMLKATNLGIWDMLDDIKNNSHADHIKLNLYEIMWNENDIRFRIKDRINNLNDSFLKEKKGYNKTKVLFKINNNLLVDTIIKILKYNTFFYDSIDIHSNEIIIESSKEFEFNYVDKINDESNYDKVFEINYDITDVNTLFKITNINDEIIRRYKGILF